jgi:hypothetical protein
MDSTVLKKFGETRRTKSRIFPYASALLAFIALSCHVSSATEVVVIISNGRVLLAADSVATHYHHGKPTTIVCKISQNGTIFWTGAGLYDLDNANFHLGTIVRRIARNKTLNARELLDAVGNESLPILQKAIPVIKRELPEFYAKLKPHGHILTLFAVQGGADMAVRAYAKDFPVLDDVVSSNPARQCSGPSECILYAAPPGMDAYMESHHREVWEQDAVASIDNLMKVGHNLDPSEIGPPISILQIAPNDIRWLRQNNCPDIARVSKEENSPQAKPH